MAENKDKKITTINGSLPKQRVVLGRDLKDIKDDYEKQESLFKVIIKKMLGIKNG